MTEYTPNDASLRMRDIRAELRAFLGFEPEAGAAETGAYDLPKSRLLRALLNDRVAGCVAAMAAVVLALSPPLGCRILRRLPWRPFAALWLAR